MRRRFACLLAPLLFVLLGGVGPFEGCDGTADREPRPLPFEPAGACFEDDDCVPTGCEALRCHAGACVEVAPIRDGDGDGHAPPPCGVDCDDSDASIMPTAIESCDLVDQDCDGNVDEGALPSIVQFDLATIDPTMSATAWDDRILLSDAKFTTRGVRTRRLALTGTLGTVEPLLETSRTVLATDAAPDEGGAWFALALAPEAANATPMFTLVRLVRGADGSVEISGAPVTHDSETETVRAVAMIALEGTPYVAWDDDVAGRFAWSPGWSSAIQIGEGLVGGLGPLDIATDGSRIAIPIAPDELVFVAREDGALVATTRVGAPLHAGTPLESGEGHVLAAVHHSEGPSLRTVSATGIGPLSRLPGSGNVRIAIDRTPEGLLVTRSGVFGTGAWLVDPAAPTTLLRAFPPARLTGEPRDLVGLDVVSTTRGTAIVSNFGGAGSTLSVLACGD